MCDNSVKDFLFHDFEFGRTGNGTLIVLIEKLLMQCFITNKSKAMCYENLHFSGKILEKSWGHSSIRSRRRQMMSSFETASGHKYIAWCYFQSKFLQIWRGVFLLCSQFLEWPEYKVTNQLKLNYPHLLSPRTVKLIF